MSAAKAIKIKIKQEQTNAVEDEANKRKSDDKMARL